jgi:hypothetical protein
MSGSAPELVELVRKALCSGLSNCVEWVDDKAANRVRSDPANRGMTPEGIKAELIRFVLEGGRIDPRKEDRDGWIDRREYWYRVVIRPLDGFPRALFVELELIDDDPEFPMVVIVNAHPQRS